MNEKKKLGLICFCGYIFNLIDFLSTRYLASIDINGEKNPIYKLLLLNHLDLPIKIGLSFFLFLGMYLICINKEVYQKKYYFECKFIIYSFIISYATVCLNNIWIIIQYKGGYI